MSCHVGTSGNTFLHDVADMSYDMSPTCRTRHCKSDVRGLWPTWPTRDIPSEVDSQLLNESVFDSEVSSDDTMVDPISGGNIFGDDIITFKENIVRLDHTTLTPTSM